MSISFTFIYSEFIIGTSIQKSHLIKLYRLSDELMYFESSL